MIIRCLKFICRLLSTVIQSLILCDLLTMFDSFICAELNIKSNMKQISLIALIAFSLFIVSCSDDSDDVVTVDAGTITGGPFTFAIDGIPDMVSGIAADANAVGTKSSWIVTNDQNEILGLPGTLADLEGNDFDGAGVGVCLIWYIRYEDGLIGLEVGENTSGLSGTFDISNSIMVTRENGWGALTLGLSGLEDLGSDFAYEGWVIVDGNPVTTGTFTIGSDGTPSATTFDVTQANLDAATMFVLSIEPSPDTDPAPAATKVLAGAISNGAATLTSEGVVGDFSDAAGSYFLRTPTDEDDGVDNGNNEYGIWFGTPGAPPTPNFVLPEFTATSGWAYEGWVVVDGTPISTGTFTAFDMEDSSNGFSGTNAGPPVPGEDFFNNAPEGITFPLDVRGKTVVISVEPVPDNSDAPFAIKPLLGTAGQDTAPSTHALGQNLGSLPTGTVSF